LSLTITRQRSAGTRRALADFFRLENDKVVEHWDVIQDVPKTTASNNGMF
jgi:predicted SnoaL-like aldol condensation-catalyzing enzyme